MKNTTKEAIQVWGIIAVMIFLLGLGIFCEAVKVLAFWKYLWH